MWRVGIKIFEGIRDHSFKLSIGRAIFSHDHQQAFHIIFMLVLIVAMKEIERGAGPIARMEESIRNEPMRIGFGNGIVDIGPQRKSVEVVPIIECPPITIVVEPCDVFGLSIPRSILVMDRSPVVCQFRVTCRWRTGRDCHGSDGLLIHAPEY